MQRNVLKLAENKVLGIEDFNSMSHMAQEIDPGCRGLIFLPYLSGERTPHMNPSAKGMFLVSVYVRTDVI